MTRNRVGWLACAAVIALVGGIAGLTSSGYRFEQSVARSPNNPGELSDITDTQGRFRFDGLRSSSHLLRVDSSTLPPNIRPGTGVVLTLSPGVTQAVGVAPGLTLRATYDADGTTLDGALFYDSDGDHRQRPDEPGLPGVRVIDPDVYQYFTPGNDDNVEQAFADQLVATGCIPPPLPDVPSRVLASTISLTGSSNGTQVFYDHWEDGYDPDPVAPGATTEVFTLNAGQVRLLQNNIPIPRNPATRLYDGRDRITIIGQPIAVVRAGWLTSPGTLLAGAWEVPRVSIWGQRYILPIGEDLGRGGTLPQGDFDYVSAGVMAAYDGTVVQIDANADGVFERTETINTGQTIFVRGSVNPNVVSIHSGAQINASLPVQVQVRAGNCRAPYSGRSFTLIPVERWSNDYWSPVSGFATGQNGCTVGYIPAQPNDSADTDIYLYNPNAAPLVVTYEDASGTGTLTIPPRSTGSYLNLHPNPAARRSNTQGVHLTAPAPFWGTAAVDSTTLGNNGADFDWSYSLLPAIYLSSRAIMGWAPGSVATPLTSATNGSTVYVQATADGTVVTADLDDDGTPDQFDTDGDGLVQAATRYGHDETTSNLGITLNRGQTLRISDPNDHDMTGALISSQDNDHRIMVVYGEDACRATRARPYLDLGYTVLPLPVPELNKSARLVVDADRSGDISPGDTLEYSVTAANTGTGQIFGPALIDTLPYTYSSYIVGSFASTPPPLPPGVAYDDGSGTFVYVPPGPPGTPDPRIHAFRARYADLQPGDSIHVTFRVQLHASIPLNVRSMTNRVTLTSRNLGPLVADATTPINQADVLIHKTDGRVTVNPGDRLTYTLTYTNAGPGIAHNVVMTDTLPPTAINVSTPTVPGVITPTILPGLVIFQLGTLPAGYVGRTFLSMTLAPNTPTGTNVVNTIVIHTTSFDPDLSNNTSTDINRVPGTTAVVLAEFGAERQADGVLVHWRTVAELDNYGFRVYRSSTPSRAGARLITAQIIPGQGRGHAGAASYSIVDRDAPKGPLYYWLEDIDLNGVSTFHGPAIPGVAAAGRAWFLPIVAR